MRIKHFAGYGLITAVKIPDKTCTLHIRVTGNHERGIHRDDEFDLFNWIVKKFDKSFKDKTWVDWHKLYPRVSIEDGYVKDDAGNLIETCDYRFYYSPDENSIESRLYGL